MRIVGGTLSGRRIEPPLSRVTRPMMDRVRESLFNVLAHRDWGSEIGDLFAASTHVLDAFCGTGALAFEALSRGAVEATLFDKDRQALDIATKNAATLGLKHRCAIQMADALAPPRAGKPCRLVFLAPPYRKELIPPAFVALDQAGWIARHAVIVAETARKEELPVPEGLALQLQRFYGDTGLHFITR
jgi:16S rRNA (guanine966-N2)-methyltransferase